MTKEKEAALRKRPHREKVVRRQDRPPAGETPVSTVSTCGNSSPQQVVLGRLEAVTGQAPTQQGTGGWTAICPAHDDQHPSLSISEGKDGRVLLHCHAGCPTQEIVARLGLDMSDLFPAALTGPLPSACVQTLDQFCEERHLKRSVLENCFGVSETTFRGNNAVRPCLRYATAVGVDKVKFLDGGRPKYVWAGRGGRAHLYGLEQATALGGATLYIVNGEPSVWACLQEGIPAACLCGECVDLNGEIREFFSQSGFITFRVIYDLDEAGRKGALKLVRALREAGLDATALELPASLGEGGDVDDLHRLHGSELLPALDALPALQGSDLPEPPEAAGSSPALTMVLALQRGCTQGQLEAALRDLASRASGLDRISLLSIRATAARHLQSLGIPSAVRLLDAAIEVLDEPASTCLFEEIEPWPEEVDGSALLQDIVNLLTRYLALPAGAAETCALWVLFSHAQDAFEVCPSLAITSPVMQCGKSTALTLLHHVVPRPLSLAHTSPAAVFRIIEQSRPTLLLDEAETYVRQDNQELRGLLNAGHTRSQARVLRVCGEDHHVEVFSVYTPKIFALIGDLPGTLQDRSIQVQMRRKTEAEDVQRLRIDRLAGETLPLSRRAARWAQDHIETLRNADPFVPAGIERDRARDNWRPLLAIAEAAGEPWIHRARTAAVQLELLREDSQSRSIELLACIRSVFNDQNHPERISSVDLLQHLVRMEDHPWAEWRDGRPISANQVARWLRPFQITPEKWRAGAETVRGYYRAAFTDAFSRYLLPPRSAPSPTRNQTFICPTTDATPAPAATPSDLGPGAPPEPAPSRRMNPIRRIGPRSPIRAEGELRLTPPPPAGGDHEREG